MSQQRANQLVEAGVWLRLSGDHAGARRLFEQALKLDPGNQRATQMLATDPLQQPPKPPAPPPPAPVELAPPPQPIPLTHVAPPGMSIDMSPPPPSTKPYNIEGDWSMALGTANDGDGVSATIEDEPPPPVQPRPLVEGAKSAWDSQSNPGFDVSTVYPNGVDAMDLVARDALPPKPVITAPIEPLIPKTPVMKSTEHESDEVETLLNGAKDLIDLDDHSGAMDLIMKAAEMAPNDPRVKKMRDKSEATLQAMFESKIGRMDAVPKVVLKDDEIIWLNLDHRAGFVLAQIDGSVTFDDVFAVSGMSRLDTARILAQLVDEGVIQSS